MYGTGKANINIDKINAGTLGNWTITYEAGEYGVDDRGEIIIARRDVCDSDIPQFEDSKKPGYVIVYGNVDATLKIRYVVDRYIRPWKGCISIRVLDGSLKPGDKIYVQFGANEEEGQGYRIQTFAEKEHVFKVLVDCAGSGNFYDVDKQPIIEILGGYINQLQGVVPSIVKVGQPFDLFVRAMDNWGNISNKYEGIVNINIKDKEYNVKLIKGIGTLKDLTINEQGVYTYILNDKKKDITGQSNPIICKKENIYKNLYWGDMHGQTKETVGTGTPDLYFSFARDYSKMDFCAWQGNDFQITDETWVNINKVVKEYNQPNKYITFLGYEWSGTTPVGGDHNIYFLNDNQKIHRSYHWQIDMKKRDGTERSPISKLWNEFDKRDDVMAVPHVGGRYGNLDYYNSKFIHNIEIHSHHGTFQWMLEDALKKKLKVGVVAASDDHTCRPGLSYPTRVTSRGGFVSFDVIGGYTGVYSKNLSRKAIWDALIKRHCYGTTGERIILEVKCNNNIMGDEFKVDKPPIIDIKAYGTDIISEIEIKRGIETIYRYSDSLPIKKNTIKIQWSGVRVRSRGKKTNWDGNITIKNGRIKTLKQFAFNQPDEGASIMSNQEINFKSNTSGDIDGIEVELEYNKNTQLVFNTKPISFTLPIDQLKKGRVIKQAGGVNLQVEVSLSREETSRNVEISFEDKDIIKGNNPYWIKVIQKDGHMAWSSPMYIEY